MSHRRRKHPDLPPCPCGVKRARYKTRIGWRCAAHAKEQWGITSAGRALIRETWAAWWYWRRRVTA